MNTIQEDQYGLYVSAGGWKTRPYGETRYKAGDKVKTHHYGGSCRAGVGKDESCKRGEYLEYWVTTGLAAVERFDPESVESKSLGHLTEGDQIKWYKKHNSHLFTKG